MRPFFTLETFRAWKQTKFTKFKPAKSSRASVVKATSTKKASAQSTSAQAGDAKKVRLFKAWWDVWSKGPVGSQVVFDRAGAFDRLWAGLDPDERASLGSRLVKIAKPANSYEEALKGFKSKILDSGRVSAKTAPAKPSNAPADAKPRRKFGPPPAATSGKKQPQTKSSSSVRKVPSDFLQYPISKELIRKMNKGREQNYTIRKLKIVQAKLIREHNLPALNVIQGNLLRYFKNGGQKTETFKNANLSEEITKEKRILGDNDYGKETRDAIMAFQEALIARGFLDPLKSSKEFPGYTNKDGLYGPNTHKMWKKATQHGLYDEKNLEKLPEDRKNELKTKLTALSKQKGGDTKTKANVDWAKWMLSRLGVKQKTKETDTNTRGATTNDIKILKKKVSVAKKQGRISDKRSPGQKCVPGCDIGWDLYIEIQHAANNLEIDTLEGRTVTPIDPCIPIKAYCDKLAAEKKKSLEIKPTGILEGWTRSEKSVDTNLGFKVAKWSPPAGSRTIPLYIPTEKMNFETIQKINAPVAMGRPWSPRHLPIYNENGKGIGWLLGGTRPYMAAISEKLPAPAKFEKIVSNPETTNENNIIFENYFRKNERK